MSEVMFTVRDHRRALHATIHGSHVEPIVAALSADPETIEELQTALGRFVHREEQERFFAHWRPGVNDQPWDAGVCIVDLTARLVVCESTYSSPGPTGGVEIRNLPGRDDVCVPYHLADDWLFLRQVECWEAPAQERRRQRLAVPPLDARAVLYGNVCDFLATECSAQAARCAAQPMDDKSVEAWITATHARWLLTPREDLRGRCPRDVLVARQNHITWDMQDRSEQWAQLGKCPPGLAPESAAYRYGGFGTHEIVVYYYLVRFLLGECWRRLSKLAAGEAGPADEIRRLIVLRDEWLQAPNVEDLSGHIPASIIERERRRLPEGHSGAEAAVDHDCPLCQMMAEDTKGVYFWGLDGCNMDDDFAFDYHHKTRESWEQERRKWEASYRKMEEQRSSGAEQPVDSVWQRSYVNPEVATSSPGLVLFGVGSHLAELTQDLHDAAADQRLIDDLNRNFGNLREVSADGGGALVEPVIEKLREALLLISESHSTLREKCEALDQELTSFARLLTVERIDEDLPF